jgi:signal transduction histidine kinase
VRTPNVFRTQAFRIIVIYLAIFTVSAVALAGFVYWNTAIVLDTQNDETIDAEVTGLIEQYQSLGLPGLTDVIIGRSIRGGQGLYLLANNDRRPIAGNLDIWPTAMSATNGFVEFTYERRIGDQTELRSARGKVFGLAQGFYMLVARDVHERRELEALFTTMLFWGTGLMILLGVAGGALISRNFLARLDVINRTSRQIMGGDLTRRVPVTRAGDEFDDLSGHLNRMLDRIERLMRGMREVSDNVAHDLRSPLNRLRNRLELAGMRQSPDTETAKDIDAAVQETDRLIATFNALLLIAEAEAGSVRETMEDFRLDEVIEGIGELYSPLADDKHIDFAVEVPEGGSFIRGNRNLVSQALANLVDNAIKYTQAGGKVRVTLENRATGPTLTVADTGPGIPSEERPRVIERFVRLESSRNSPGTGLGLSLVAAVARLHEAELQLDDNNPGLRASLRFKRPAEMARAPHILPGRAEPRVEAVH